MEAEEEEEATAAPEEATPMEEETGEELDPLDAYMEEVKEEVKKFNMGTMRGGNDKVSVAQNGGSLTRGRSGGQPGG